MKQYSEEELRKVLGKELQTSGEADARLEQVYRKIRSGEIKKRPHHDRWYRAAGAAAAVVAAGVFCVSNPAIAARLPLIGHIFEEVGDQAAYPGDYGQVAMPLSTECETEAAVAKTESSPYIKVSDGMTVTLSEIYCNEVALYLSMELKADEPFENYAAEKDGSPILCLNGSAKFSFNEQETDLFGYLSGKLVDENTYIGLYRLDLREAKTDIADYVAAVEEQKEQEEKVTDNMKLYDELVKEVALPENFEVQIQIDRIVGDLNNPVSIYEAAGVEQPSEERLEAMSDEEWNAYMKDLESRVPEYFQYPSVYTNYWYDGPFAYDLQVQVDHERTVTVPVDEGSEGGYYMASVTRTPFELYVDEVGLGEGDGVLQVLDADGKLLETGMNGGSLDTLRVDGRDLSKIDLYSIPFEQWETCVKGDYFDTHETDENGKTLKELLDTYCTYHREVVIDSEIDN